MPIIRQNVTAVREVKHAELHQIWTKHWSIIGHPGEQIRFISVASFRNEGDSNNRDQISNISFL